MIRNVLSGGAVALLLAGGAAAQSPMPAPGPAMPTPDYIVAAGQSDQFEIQEGKLAETMGKSNAVKQFGRQMVTEHMKTSDAIKGAAMKSGLSVSPPPLRADQQAMIADLRTRKGADFDQTYVQQQQAAHQEALQVHGAYAAGGDDANLAEAARQIVPVVQQHIGMLSAMAPSGK